MDQQALVVGVVESGKGGGGDAEGGSVAGVLQSLGTMVRGRVE